ncbi:MAG: hypothetical protein SPK23_05975 [Eubacteriales bacterium]|nr:hypothetical protein [Clostridiales bacterium]MDY5836649.1 hypothetical protein [Eubacteriales bacterium]
MLRLEWIKLGKKCTLLLCALALMLASWLLTEFIYLTPQDKAGRVDSQVDPELCQHYAELPAQWAKQRQQAEAKGNSVLFKDLGHEQVRLQAEAEAYQALITNISEIGPDYRWSGILTSPFPFFVQVIMACFLCDRLLLRERQNGYFALVKSCAYRPLKRFAIRLGLLTFLLLGLSCLVYALPYLVETIMRGPLNNAPAQALPALQDLDRHLNMSGLWALLFASRYLAALGLALSITFLSIFAENFLWSAFIMLLSLLGAYTLKRSIPLNSRYVFWRIFNPAWVLQFFAELPQNIRLTWGGRVLQAEYLAMSFWLLLDLLLLRGIFRSYEQKNPGYLKMLLSRGPSKRKQTQATGKQDKSPKAKSPPGGQLAMKSHLRLGEGRKVMRSAPVLLFLALFLMVFAYRTFSYKRIPAPQEKRLEALYMTYGGHLEGETAANLEAIDQAYASKAGEIEALRQKLRSAPADSNVEDTEKIEEEKGADLAETTDQPGQNDLSLADQAALFQELEDLQNQSLPSPDFYPLLEKYREIKARGGDYLLAEKPYQLLLGLEASSLQAQDYVIYASALVLLLFIAFAPDFEPSSLAMVRALSGGRDDLIRKKIKLSVLFILFFHLVAYSSRFYKLWRFYPLPSLAPHLINISPDLILPISVAAAYLLQAFFSCLICYCLALSLLLSFFQSNRLMSLALGFCLVLSPLLLYRAGAVHISVFSLLCGAGLAYPLRSFLQVMSLSIIAVSLRLWLITSWREGGLKLRRKYG